MASSCRQKDKSDATGGSPEETKSCQVGLFKENDVDEGDGGTR